MIAALAQANLFELKTMFNALTGHPDVNETIFRKPHIHLQQSPSSAIDYEDKVNPLDWVYAVNYERASTKSFPTNVNGVEPEELGLWGQTTMYMDENGVNHLTIELNAGWDTRWESSSKGDSYYGGIGWTMQNMDFITVNGSSITVDTGAEWEFAVQGATRDPNDTSKVTTPALLFDPLLQATTGLTELDLGKTGVEIFGGDINTDAATPTAWVVDDVYSSDVVSGKKKYIVGMGVTATRPFKPTSSRVSGFTIENLNNYVICGKQWVASKDVNGVYNEGCAVLRVNLPVPEIVEPEDDKKKDDDNDEPVASGAASLAYSALAAATLMALTY